MGEARKFAADAAISSVHLDCITAGEASLPRASKHSAAVLRVWRQASLVSLPQSEKEWSQHDNSALVMPGYVAR
jgi:hypothetical protein